MTQEHGEDYRRALRRTWKVLLKQYEYVPHMELVEQSVYSPRRDYTPPEPEWKSRDYIRDVLNE